MLVRFTVENFMSFKERTEFNMLSGDYRRHKHHVTDAGGVPLVRAAAIYGANGSGKSNLVKAMVYFCMSLRGSLSDLLHLVYLPFELDAKMDLHPSILIGEFYLDGKFIELGFAIKHGRVIREWMNELSPNKDGILKEIYLRVADEADFNKFHFKVDKNYLDSEKAQLRFDLISEDYKENLYPIFNKLVGKGSSIIDKTNSKILGFTISTATLADLFKQGHISIYLLTSPGFHTLINEMISVADIGLKGISIETVPLNEYLGPNDVQLKKEVEDAFVNGAEHYNLSNEYVSALAFKEAAGIVVKVLYFIHKGANGKDISFITMQESDGTLTSLTLLFFMAFAKLHDQATLVIDEIERSLHPLLVTAFMKKFMADPDVKGQLIFTTHESRLLDLDIFRQDEIWFAKKNEEGASTIYPLSDYEVRHDLDLENGYLKGRFGGVPYLGELEHLNLNTQDEKKVHE